MRTKLYDICNKIVVILNILIFFILEWIGTPQSAEFMYDYGAMYPEAVLADGEWYRLFTCMFLHFGIEHLGNNMLILFFMGDNLERAVGHLKYVIIYLLSGLGGSILSMLFMIQSQNYAVSGGASGAIFGVVGAMIFIVIRNKGRLEDLTTKQLVFMAVLSLYHGFSASGVDNFAHIGGLVSGFLLAIIFYRKPAPCQEVL